MASAYDKLYRTLFDSPHRPWQNPFVAIGHCNPQDGWQVCDGCPLWPEHEAVLQGTDQDTTGCQPADEGGTRPDISQPNEGRIEESRFVPVGYNTWLDKVTGMELVVGLLREGINEIGYVSPEHRSKMVPTFHYYEDIVAKDPAFLDILMDGHNTLTVRCSADYYKNFSSAKENTFPVTLRRKPGSDEAFVSIKDYLESILGLPRSRKVSRWIYVRPGSQQKIAKNKKAAPSDEVVPVDASDFVAFALAGKPVVELEGN